MSGARVLFQVRNRRGLGHQMRVRNIAAALREHAPDLDLRFHAAVAPEPDLWDASLPVTHDAEIGWAECAAVVDPDVVVYDTVLPEPTQRLVSVRARLVFVLRGRNEARTHELMSDPFLDRVDAFVVPHEADEPGRPDRFLPPHLVERAHVVGTIGRLPRRDRIHAMRSRYGAGDGRLLLTSTVGGGGFREQADRFFGAVLLTAHRVAETLPEARHVVVLGPNYRNRAMEIALASVPGVEVVSCEPELVDLLAASDLVIAEGGYNTVTEVRLAEVAAVFVPSERGLDDQVARVDDLARHGAARVWLPGGDTTSLADEVVGLLADAAARRAMRDRHRRRPVDLGNARAAAVIAGVAARSTGTRDTPIVPVTTAAAAAVEVAR